MSADPSPPPPPTDAPEGSGRSDGNSFAGLVGLLMFAAAAFVAAGLYRMYTYDTGDALVGGDAYNYIILVTRGAGLVGAGTACAAMAAAAAVLGNK